MSGCTGNILKSGVKYLFCLAFISFFSSCQKEESENNTLPTRTVIAYMIADNNLDNFAVNDINEMEEGWQEGLDGNLIVYVDRAAGASPAHPVVYKIAHDTTSNIASPIVNVYKEQNSVDADIMRRVLSGIISSYPAQSYGLILWSHGTAWLPAGTKMSNKTNYSMSSFGKDGVDEMNIFDLKEALAHHFDFIIFDACYMGAIEVIYELRNKANYILSSSTEVLSAGYPYRDIIGKLFRLSIDYADVANTFFQSYAALEGAMQSASVSVIKTSHLDVLADKVRQIMIDTPNLQYVNGELIQQFSTGKNETLFDFDSFIAAVSTNKEYYPEFNEALSQVVIYKNCTSSILDNLQIDIFSGMSIFIPNTFNKQYYDFYENFDWYKNSSYDNYFSKFIHNN
jgi:hypothetical protein